MNTTHIRVTPETKKEIIRLIPIYEKKLFEEGKEKEKIAKIMKDGMGQGDFIEVLLNYWKERETVEK